VIDENVPQYRIVETLGRRICIPHFFFSVVEALQRFSPLYVWL
jgi:hypothetical protein